MLSFSSASFFVFSIAIALVLVVVDEVAALLLLLLLLLWLLLLVGSGFFVMASMASTAADRLGRRPRGCSAGCGSVGCSNSSSDSSCLGGGWASSCFAFVASVSTVSLALALTVSLALLVPIIPLLVVSSKDGIASCLASAIDEAVVSVSGSTILNEFNSIQFNPIQWKAIYNTIIFEKKISRFRRG